MLRHHPSDCLLVLRKGPKDSTVGDFWHMVYESGSAVVVMLTCNVESGSIKKVGGPKP
jgi:protein tyrosine phosphatase